MMKHFLQVMIVCLAALPALAGTPTLVHYTSNGSNAGGATGSSFVFNLNSPTLAGNIVLCGINFTGASTVTVTIADDKSNTWTQLVKNTDPSNTGYTYGIWGTAAATGTQNMTVTLSVAENNFHMECGEFAFASLTVDKTFNSGTTGVTGPTVAAGSQTTTSSGDLIYQVAFNGDGGNGYGFVNVATSIVPATGFTILSPNLEFGNGAQYGVQSSAGAINPTIAINQAAHDTFDTAAVALQSSASGTLPTGGYILEEGVFTIPNGQPSPRTEQIPCSTGDTLAFGGSTDPANFDLFSGATNGTTSWSDSNSNTYNAALVSGHQAAVGQIVWAYNVTCTSFNSHTVSVAFTDHGSPDPVHWYILRGYGARDTGMGSAAAIGTGAGNSAGCVNGICYAVANQGSKSSGTTTCPNAAASNTGIQVTPSTSGGIIIDSGYTGSGPTCGRVGSSSGVTFDYTWMKGENDACCGLLDSSSIYGHAFYSSASQVTIQDNWANGAATAASAGGYIAIAFQNAASGSSSGGFNKRRKLEKLEQ